MGGVETKGKGPGRVANTRNQMRGRRVRSADRDDGDLSLRDTAAQESGAMNPRRFKRGFPEPGEPAQALDDGIGDPVVSEAIPEQTVFSLLIPRAAEGNVLVLFSSPLKSGAQAEPASLVGKLELDDTPGEGEGEGDGEDEDSEGGAV